METIKKIVILGPESTGKSTLCKNLAQHYHTIWVPEYAREYLEKNGSSYVYDDLKTIAEGQIRLEGNASNAILNSQSDAVSNREISSKYLFIDTDLYVMKIWSEYVFNQCDYWILDKIAEKNYDLYLLCDVDLPWVEDQLRENPDLNSRKKLYCFYKDCMVNQQVKWFPISGSYEQRLTEAIHLIDDYFKK